jgi:hypothetical protein
MRPRRLHNLGLLTGAAGVIAVGLALVGGEPSGSTAGDQAKVAPKLSLRVRPARVYCALAYVLSLECDPPPEGKDPLVGDANFEISPGEDFFALLHKPKETTAHGAVRSEYPGKSESCGGCHEVLFHGMRIEKTFTEWTLSEFARRDVKCQDCHMVRYSGQAATQGPFREILRRHDFPGLTLPPPGFPNRGYQEEETRFFLKTALRVSVLLNESVQAGTEMPITVTLKNSGTGHNFPAASFRQLWIEVTVLDAVTLGSFLLSGKPAPVAPFPACGLDRTFGEGLSCDVQSPPCRRETTR